ncbi:MAG: hypothetical protein HOP11_01125 [Saprospiraceae bacterium]|nr:hypothetical protein [Saprospiraceae bacterium]
MKTKIYLFGLLILLFTNCSSPKYLPTSSKIDVNQYGSYIKLIHKAGFRFNIVGELIAIDSSKIVVLTENTKKCTILSVSDVKHFRVMYAKPKHYAWSVFGFLGYPYIHGGFAGITIPIHLIVTISVTAAGEKAFTYSDKKITYEKLKMFARFPQGIPPSIDLASIL